MTSSGEGCCVHGLAGGCQAPSLVDYLLALAGHRAGGECLATWPHVPAARDAGVGLRLSSQAALHQRLLDGVLRRQVLQRPAAGRRRGRHDGAQLRDDAEEDEEHDGVPAGHGCHHD